MRPIDALIFVLAVAGFVAAWSFVRSRLLMRALAGNTDARVARLLAIQEAHARGHASVQPVHLLLALALDPRGERTLRAAGADPEAVRLACEELLKRLSIPRLALEAADYRSPNELAVAAGGWFPGFFRRAAARQRATVAGFFVQLTFEDQVAAVLDQYGVTRDVLRDLRVPVEPVAPAVEVINDDVTTYDFVVTSLCDIAGMTDQRAHAFARAVAARGREWFDVPSSDDAQRIARALVERARAAGFPLEATAVAGNAPR